MPVLAWLAAVPSRSPLFASTSSCPECDLSGLGFTPWASGSKPFSLAEWRALVPEPHDQINGRVPPGIPIPTNSTRLSAQLVNDVCFVNWWIPGRPRGYRTPIHVHPRPQTVCVVSGAVMTIADGMPDELHTAGECYLMPAMTKMVNLAVGNGSDGMGYTDFDTFRVPLGEPEWVVVEPGPILAAQDLQFVRDWQNSSSCTM